MAGLEPHFGDRIAERLERLKQLPAKIGGIELIILFGSLATGTHHSLSDIDLAFQVRHLDALTRGRILRETSEALETDAVDIVFLNDDLPYRLRYEIAWNGKPLFEARPGLLSDFKVLAWALWADFKPLADWQRRVFWERVEKTGFGK
ncbi:MAG: nucleotidyltransferase domain-containing protein [Candidatus Sumerlaeia bacterium]|nr:nucleotidyltransferase domain-containing protein [Candidatus Sumerlaeia bacterium]